MSTNSTTFLQTLQFMTQQQLDQANIWRQANELPTLQYKSSPQQWSALECLEHLTLTNAFYLPELQHNMKDSSAAPAEMFRSSWLGEYMGKSMLPRNKGMKFKTLSSINPNGAQLGWEALDTFTEQHQQLLNTLEQAKQAHLKKVKVRLFRPRWIKMPLGDVLRFVVYHNERHLQQALRAVAEGRRILA